MRKYMILLIITTIFLSNTVWHVSAQTTSDIYMINCEDTVIINSDQSSMITSEYTIVNNGTTDIGTINIRLNTITAKNISIYTTKGVQKYTTSISSLGTELEINLKNTIAPHEKAKLEIQYITTDLVSIQNIDDSHGTLQLIFIYYVRPTYAIYNYSLTVAIPRSAYLNDNISQPIYPIPTSNFTDGIRMNFQWEKSKILPGQENLFVLFYEQNIVTTQFSANLFELLAFLGAGIIIGMLLAKFVPRLISRVRIKNKKTSRLTRDEKKIIKYLKRKGGIAPQKNIYLDLNMSQARISLILSDLEEKGHIRRDKRGRENIVRLAEYID